MTEVARRAQICPGKQTPDDLWWSAATYGQHPAPKTEIIHQFQEKPKKATENRAKNEEKAMAAATPPSETAITRKQLIAALNEDLAREYQAIIAYVNYSQVLKGAAYMNIAAELEVHAGEELQHAIILANQIDYMGGMPVVVPKPVKTSEKAEEMLRFDLDNENETIRNYRIRIRQCDALGEYATAEHIRTILLQEQDHQISLATALGIDAPDLSEPSKPSQE
jgi:bacterioferritin